MRTFCSFLMLLFASVTIAQTNSEVFIVNINFTPTGMLTSDLTNISNDSGYDNQPSFASDNHVLFAGNNKGQTDFYQYQIKENKKTLLGGLNSGGEYSPQVIPGQEGIAAVRLDTTGLQRLYRYDLDANTSSTLIDDLVVAYYTFYDANTIVGCYIEDENLNLFVFKKDENKSYTLLKDVGRSFYKVPNQDSVSYTVQNEEGNQDIYLLDMKTYESFFVTQLPIGVQDYAWLDESRIVIGSRNSLFIYDTFGDTGWEKMAQLTAPGLDMISRIAVSPNGKTIALAASGKSK
ncbi:MAG: hypothetical protein ABJM06_02630 [Gilvibacter sp.]